MRWQDVLGLVTIITALVVPVLAYLRSRRTDRISEQSGIAANGRAGTTQTIDGLNGLIDQLQEELGRKESRIEKLETRLDAVAAELEGVQRQLRNMQRKYGENGT